MTTHWNEVGVDLWDLDFMFAIENLDPAFGLISAEIITQGYAVEEKI